MLRFLVIVLGLMAMAKAVTEHDPLSASSPVCLTNADTAAQHTTMIAALVNGDSAKVVALGLQYQSPVVLVTSDSICSLAVTAYNTLMLNASSSASQAYVFELGSAGYAVNASLSQAPNEYGFFNTAFDSLLIAITTD